MRQRRIGEAVFLGGAVLAVWLVGDSAFAELFRRLGSVPAALLIGLAVAGVCLAVWLADGATLFEASSWSLPLGLLVAFALITVPGTLGVFIAVGGLLIVAVMILPTGAAALWYRWVLRRDR